MPYQVMNLPNAFGISNPEKWIIEKRPNRMLAPGVEYGAWRRMDAARPNAWGVMNPAQWIVEKRPEVTWMPWFSQGGSMGTRFLPQIPLRA